MNEQDALISRGGFLVPSEYIEAMQKAWTDVAETARHAPPPSRLERLRRWRTEKWYAVREAVARLVLPEGPWDHHYDWDDE